MAVFQFAARDILRDECGLYGIELKGLLQSGSKTGTILFKAKKWMEPKIGQVAWDELQAKARLAGLMVLNIYLYEKGASLNVKELEPGDVIKPLGYISAGI